MVLAFFLTTAGDGCSEESILLAALTRSSMGVPGGLVISKSLFVVLVLLRLLFILLHPIFR